MNVLRNLGSRLSGKSNLLFFTLIFSQGAWAETSDSAKEAPLGSGASDALLPMLLALLFIVFLIYAIAWVAKKMNLAPASGSHFKLVSSMSLGGRERIVIIEVQGKQHAIGVTQQSVNHLFELEQNIEKPEAHLTDNNLVNKLNKLFGYQAPNNNSNLKDS